MRNTIRLITLATFLMAITLSGCSLQSEEEAIKAAKKAAEAVFNSNEKVETNHELDTFSVYLPASMEVKKEDKSNVILKDDDQKYIVFYNQLEGPKSKLNYKAASKSEKSLLLKSFKDNNKFGYIRILSNKEDENYELQVGVGGVKITTHSSKSELKSDSEMLMEIARSIAISNKNDTQKK